MIKAPTFKPPPRETTVEGTRRHIGVELEFAAVSAHTGAKLVQQLFGGKIEKKDPHRFHVVDTCFGRFTCELDTQYAHRSYADDEAHEAEDEDALSILLSGFQRELQSLFGDISSLIMPYEVICPPIEIGDLPRLETLVDALREAGAAGTRASPFYAFGAQLNPELAAGGTEWIVAVFKAYLLLSDWLRAVISLHITRQLVDFASPFPRPYVRKVIDPDYWPDRDRFIDDYLIHNPTRNRELDLLPMFTWFDAPRVRAVVKDTRIKPRPTFHYRLPDANVGQPDWGLIHEWNRWCVVEQLAERRDVMAAMAEDWCANDARFFPENWAIRASEWLLVR